MTLNTFGGLNYFTYLCDMNYKDNPKEYKKAHYKAHREKYIESARTSKKKVLEWFRELKRGMKCSKCGENHPACIEFHHRNPEDKKFTISESITRVSKKAILEEIEKCDILCSNCHRKLHYEENLLE